MENRVREIIIRKYSGEVRKDTQTPLYEIAEKFGLHTNKISVYSEEELLKRFGTGLSSGFFSKVKLINKIKDKLSPETLEGLTQIVQVNNKCYGEILRLREAEEALKSGVKYHL